MLCVDAGEAAVSTGVATGARATEADSPGKLEMRRRRLPEQALYVEGDADASSALYARSGEVSQ